MDRRVAMGCALLGLLAAATGRASSPAEGGVDQALQEEPELSVDLNTATQGKLEALPYIGPSKAKLIIEARRQRPFRRVSQILRVKGIGPKTFLRIKRFLKVSTGQFIAAPAASRPAQPVRAPIQPAKGCVPPDKKS